MLKSCQFLQHFGQLLHAHAYGSDILHPSIHPPLHPSIPPSLHPPICSGRQSQVGPTGGMDGPGVALWSACGSPNLEFLLTVIYKYLCSLSDLPFVAILCPPSPSPLCSPSDLPFVAVLALYHHHLHHQHEKLCADFSSPSCRGICN